MAHFPKPFFRPKKNRWYVQLDGKQITLAEDRDEAFERYHALMTARPKAETPPVVLTGTTPVVTILDEFLQWLGKRVEEGAKAQRTYDWYEKYLNSFGSYADEHGRIRDLSIDRLESFHVYRWVDSKTGWKSGKRGAMIAVQRAFNWAAKAGLLKPIGGKSPLASLEKPQQGRRELLVTPTDYAKIIKLTKDEPFRDLLKTLWETGCRPNELFTVEARFVELAEARWVFPIRLSKGRKVQRVVYLTQTALAITKRLMKKHPKGPLFRNMDGEAWKRAAVNCRFGRLKEKMGVKHNLYSFRHSYCTSALQAGKLDAVTVSVLMGHRDTTMISRFYSHLTQKSGYMRDAAKKAKGA